MENCMKHQEKLYFTDTSPDLSWELTKAIVNHRTLSEAAKQRTLREYYHNRLTNSSVVDRLNTEVR